MLIQQAHNNASQRFIEWFKRTTVHHFEIHRQKSEKAQTIV